jgi:hypothetical protein
MIFGNRIGGRSVAIAAAVFLVACGDSNPLIGEWQIDEDELPSPIRAAMEMAGMGIEIEFDDDRMIIDGRSILVSYLVEDDKITVVPNGENTGDVFRVIDKSHIELVVPVIGGIVYEKD